MRGGALFVVCCAGALCALARAGDEGVVAIAGGGMVPAQYCMSEEALLAATEDMYDDFASFGITDKHAAEYTGWVVGDVVLKAVDEPHTICVPPGRAHEMGTRLGKIIAQDIAGERPEKHGRRDLDVPDDLDLDDMGAHARKAIDRGHLALDAAARDTNNWERKKEPAKSDAHGAQKWAGKKGGGNWAGDGPAGDGRDETRENDDQKRGEDDDGNDDGKNDKKDDDKKEGLTSGGGKRPGFMFNFGGDKDDSFAREKCCQCPMFHYPFSPDKQCAHGPCCPSLCRTLERLAGVLSSAKVPCCEKAHRSCLEKEKMSLFSLVIKKKEFHFEKHDEAKKDGEKGGNNK